MPNSLRPARKIAYINEFGDEQMNIPPRPFLIPGIGDAKDGMVKQMRAGAVRAMDGNLGAIDEGLHAAGLLARSAVKARVLSGPFLPLKPTTIKARARRRDPDTGKLVNTFGPRGARKFLQLQREGVPTEVLTEANLARPLYDTGALYTAIIYAIKG